MNYQTGSFFWMICDNYLLVRSVYNHVHMCWGQFYQNLFISTYSNVSKFPFYCLGFVPYKKGLLHSETTYTKKKIINCVFFMHLLFGIQVFNSSGIYFGGRLRKVIYFVFLTVLPVPIQVIELLHYDLKYQPFSYPKFHDRAEFISGLSLLSYWLAY